jgi:hypothetical protein
MSGYLDFLDDYVDPGGDWVKWTPDVAEAEPEIGGAIETFQSRGNPAGQAATSWLREKALDNHPSTVTHLLMRNGKVEAFFALCSGHVKLSQSQRKRIFRRATQIYPGRRLHELHLIQPVALIAWLAKAHDSDFPGDEILLQATATALEIIEFVGQGQIGIALNPFDEETGQFWRERYGFRQSQEMGGFSCLWRTIMTDPNAAPGGR